MNKVILNLLSLLLLGSFCSNSFAQTRSEDDFLPAYEVRLSEDTSNALMLGGATLLLIGGGIATMRAGGNVYNWNAPMTIGSLGVLGGVGSSVAAVTFLASATVDGFTEDNLKDLKKDYKYLSRYRRAAARSGELSWHEGINRIYSSFVCDGLGEQEKVRHVSDLLGRLDVKAKDMAEAGEDSMDDVADAISRFSFGQCRSLETQGAAIGILSAGIHYHL